MVRFKRLLVLVALAVLSIGGFGNASAQDATPGAAGSVLAALGLPELVIKVSDERFDMPGEVVAGRTLITLENVGQESRKSELLRLPESMTLAEIFAGTADQDVLPSWYLASTFVGFPGETLPGQTNRAVVDLTPGLYLVLDDFIQPLIVAPAGGEQGTPAPGPEPPADGEVSLFEYGFKFPETLAAGRQVWKVTNAGREAHELLLVSVPDGTTVEQIAELVNSDFATPVAGLNEESVVPAGGLGWLSPGGIGWTEVDLQPGTYAALCFAFGPDFESHAMKGMIDVVTVS
jgi:hypothetical protein